MQSEQSESIIAIRVGICRPPKTGAIALVLVVGKKKSIIDSDCSDWKTRLGMLGLQFLTLKSNIAIRVARIADHQNESYMLRFLVVGKSSTRNARIARIARIAILDFKVNYCKNWVFESQFLQSEQSEQPEQSESTTKTRQ